MMDGRPSLRGGAAYPLPWWLRDERQASFSAWRAFLISYQLSAPPSVDGGGMAAVRRISRKLAAMSPTRCCLASLDKKKKNKKNGVS